MKTAPYIVLILILSALCSLACGDPSSTSGDILSKLDSMIERSEEYEQIKLMRIAGLASRRNSAAGDADRYAVNTLLFDEYVTYNSDSAMHYINENLKLAEAAGNPQWRDRSLIDKSNLLAATGLLKEAEAIMSGIDTASLTQDLKIRYYGQMIYLYSHLGTYTGGEANEYFVRERIYKDRIMDIIEPEHPEYLWYRGWYVAGTERSDSGIISALTQRLGHSALDSRQDAKDAYILSKLYEQSGDMGNFERYMALSAIIDVGIANAEIASLEELARIMFAKGDIDRAYNYINYSLSKAIGYPNRVASFGNLRTLDIVSKAYQERNRQQQKRLRMFLILVCVLSAILAATIGIIIFQNRRLRRQGRNLDCANKTLNRSVEELSQARNQLAEANARLKELNADLQQKNEDLNEANYVKEEYIGYIFTICSNYIRKLEDFRKSIHVKAVTRKFKEIEAETDSDMMKDELKDFYKSFDSVFLHIYPDFVSDFNSLLQDDKRIVPKEGELLNTELRIYALVRLGITDSVKIAEFLHCSPQTVYNNRFKVRNKAIIEKKDFAEAVRRLGKFMERPS
ncbi:MAG: transcriptional regulator [Muribaculaceae bacterium]|nr:transcriptional regulator [Muribaculaceae bacterium]MDE5930657.1 transcriptional regulator [Muribaculaceae bacterium]